MSVMDFRDEVIQLTPSGVKYKVCGRLGRGGSADVFKVQCLYIPDAFKQTQAQRVQVLEEQLLSNAGKLTYLTPPSGAGSSTVSGGSTSATGGAQKPQQMQTLGMATSSSSSSMQPPILPAVSLIANDKHPELSGTGRNQIVKRRLSDLVEEGNEDYNNVFDENDNPSGSDLNTAAALQALRGSAEGREGSARRNSTRSSAAEMEQNSTSSGTGGAGSGSGGAPGSGGHPRSRSGEVVQYSTPGSYSGLNQVGEEVVSNPRSRSNSPDARPRQPAEAQTIQSAEGIATPDWYQAPGSNAQSLAPNAIAGSINVATSLAPGSGPGSGMNKTNSNSDAGTQKEGSVHPAIYDPHLLENYQIPMLEEGKFYALKSVMAHNAAEFQVFLREVDLLQKLAGNPYVIHLLDVTVLEQDRQLFLVLELADTDFGRYLTLNHNLTAQQILDFWVQMVIAVRTMHRDHDVIHFDLKPANFLMVNGRLKLADFGLARQLGDEATHVSRTNRAGTLKYMAPECIYQPHAQKLRLGKESDVWSLGIILCRMIYNTTPHAHLQDNHTRMLIAISDTRTKINLVDCPRLYLRDDGVTDQNMREVHDWMMNVARGCLIFEPHARFNSEDLYMILNRAKFPTVAIIAMLRDKTDQYTVLDAIPESEGGVYGAMGPSAIPRKRDPHFREKDDDEGTKQFGPTGMFDDAKTMRALQELAAEDLDLEKQGLLEDIEEDGEYDSDLDTDDELLSEEEEKRNSSCMTILIVLLSIIVAGLIGCIIAAVMLHQKRMQSST